METLIIQSDKNNIIDVEHFVTAVCDNYNINNYAATISMSLLQAVDNAIVHGNKSDSHKTVTIVADRCKGGVYFTVSDQGEGFDYRQAGSIPSCDGNKGTGLFLMNTLSDKMSFSDNGRTVRLDFFVNGISASHALERVMSLHRFYAPTVVHV